MNLLSELGKRDKMRSLPSILSIFLIEFNKFNNARARMLDYIYHMTNTLKSDFWCKNVIILSLCTQRIMDVITSPVNRQTTSGLSILMHGVISLPDATSYDYKCKFFFGSCPYFVRQIGTVWVVFVEGLLRRRNYV